MADVTVTNTTADVSGKTLVTAEGDRTISGLLTFNRGAAAAPFAVVASAAKVSNLDSDKLDGLDSTDFARQNAATSGDIYTVDWTDYSSLSTITGWSSFTVKLLRYRKVGHLVFVTFDIEGTSNSVNTSFTLPYAIAGIAVRSACQYQDNGTIGTTPGYVQAAAGGSTVSIFTNWQGAAWTAANGKIAAGQFFYETAT